MSNPESAYGVKVGDRIQLDAMPNDPCPVPTGSTGTVEGFHVDARYPQVWVTWDNGRSLNLIPGTDRWHKIGDGDG